MKCLRCGYCCKAPMMIIIIDDPDIGIQEDNIILMEDASCKYLIGDGPGMYFCAVHDKKWYPETPCYTHSQIEHANTNCRMGAYIIETLK